MMTDTMTKIASGLERAFAARGFAEPSVEDLRDAAGVSLRTLYKYTPSRDDMVLAALEHRNRRYLDHLFGKDLPTGEAGLLALIDRIANWMEDEATHGCLFHSAVAAAPADARLSDLLKRHKADCAAQAVHAIDLRGNEGELTLLFDGLTQSWPLDKDRAIASARHLARALLALPT